MIEAETSRAVTVAAEDNKSPQQSDISNSNSSVDRTYNEKPMRTASNDSRSPEERLKDILYPSDLYTEDQRYWADLPFWERQKFVNAQSNNETKREAKLVWNMFKRDPLEPFRVYFNTYVVKGLGLFIEGYILFSVSNLNVLFKQAFPTCFSTHTECSAAWVSAIDYIQVVAIIVGQILVGVQCDWISRRFGMIQDSVGFVIGSLMLTSMWGVTLQGWIICYAFSVAVIGGATGGEYPVTSTSAMESSSSRGASKDDRLHRGRRVQLSFLQQGWGQLFNQTILILLVLATNTNLGPGFSQVAVQWSFRLSFGFITVVALLMLYIRVYKVKTADDALKAAKRRQNTSGYDVRSLKLASSHFGGRLLATTVGWFANDFAFYGAKIFSSVFIGTLVGNSNDVKEIYIYNLANILISLSGYYLAAFLLDHKSYGRRTMQANGFMFLFIFLLISTFAYDKLTVPGAGIRAFQAIFFLLNWWNQFGPNATTFLVAAEVYPSSIRASAHGVSAAAGKLGALVPTILYSHIDNKTKFQVVAWFALLGWIVTVLFLPDTTGLDLREQERYWQYVLDGRQKEYHGIAVHPVHLSVFERVVLKRHLAYDAERDQAAKVEELRLVYESIKHLNGVEDHLSEHELTDEQRDFLDQELSGFFASEAKLRETGIPHTTHLTTNAPLAKVERQIS